MVHVPFACRKLSAGSKVAADRPAESSRSFVVSRTDSSSSTTATVGLLRTWIFLRVLSVDARLGRLRAQDHCTCVARATTLV